MIIDLTFRGEKVSVDLSQGIDISSTYGLPEREPNAWHAPKTRIEPFQAGDWIGSVSEGATINFFDIHLNPHANGTHTECFGHIDASHHSVNDCVKDFFGFIEVVKVKPRQQGEDWVVLKEDIPNLNLDELNAVAIWVEGIPFPKNFSGTNPAFFQAEILGGLAEQEVLHFVTNMPSVDREEDGGALLSHKAFWQYPESTRKNATITELACFPGKLKPGKYFYNLHLAPFHNDAVPSRWVLYPFSYG